MFSIIKYQNNVLNFFVDLQFWSILLLEQVKIIKCFQKNVNALLKKKKMPEYITDETEDIIKKKETSYAGVALAAHVVYATADEK